MTLVRRDFGALAPKRFFDGAVRRILDLQRSDGSIPWYDGGVIDAWNHTHAAMGLSVAGCRHSYLHVFGPCSLHAAAAAR